MAERRRIIVDADLNKRLATELKFRGRDAVSLANKNGVASREIERR